MELARLLSGSNQESDRRSAESCLQRAKLIDPSVDVVSPASATQQEVSAEDCKTEAVLIEPVDGFFANDAKNDRDSLNTLVQFSTLCRPIVITGGEFCRTRELYRLLSQHPQIIAIDVANTSLSEIETALRSSGSGVSMVLLAPHWECRLKSLADWPGATIVWLDRDTDERVTEMTDHKMVLDRHGPWGVMRPWSVHPDGGMAAFTRSLKQAEPLGYRLESKLQTAWQKIKNTRPFRRTPKQADWLAPEYCRIMDWLWQTFSSETAIEVNDKELAENPEFVTRRILTFADIPIDEAHQLAITHQHDSPPTANKRKTAWSPWC